MGYGIVRRLARLLVHLFYRRVERTGAERIPATGPLILAANHHNSLVDPMLLLATCPRRLVTLAKAPLFHHPLIGPFLRMVGGIPVHRRQEAGDDPVRNEAMFASAARTLREGGAILIFPEGMSQAEPQLMKLRTGTARMLLSTEAASDTPLHITLLPVGLLFEDPGTFRGGWALVLVGEPVTTQDLLAVYRHSPEHAVRELTDRLTEALRRKIVEAGDCETLRLLKAVEELWREEVPETLEDSAARIAWMQQGMRVYAYLLPREAVRLAALRREVEAYVSEAERAGLEGAQLSRSYSLPVVVRYALRKSVALLLSLPLALLGVLLHALPYRLTGSLVRLMARAAEEEATDKIAAGLILYPLSWVFEGWVVWRFLGAFGLVCFVALLAPTGFLALAWREHLHEARREARGFLQFLLDQDLAHRLLARRRAIVRELAELARLVPESVIQGTA